MTVNLGKVRNRVWRKLLADHKRLAHWCVRKWGLDSLSRDDQEDLHALALIALARAARTFVPERLSPKTGRPVKFNTYAGWVIRNEVLRQRERLARHGDRKPLTFSEVGTGGEEDNPFDNFPSLGREDRVEEVLATRDRAGYLMRNTRFTVSERMILKRKFERGLTHEEIAAELGLSTTQVRGRAGLAIKKLRATAERLCKEMNYS